MRLVQLTYASTLSPGVDVSELARIKESSERNNPKNGISGTLVFGNDFFLQHLEGGREAVNQLFNKISRDPRHSHILLLDYSELAERDFDQWAMRVLLLTQEKINLILKFTTTGNFNPYEMSGQSTVALLKFMRS